MATSSIAYFQVLFWFATDSFWGTADFQLWLRPNADATAVFAGRESLEALSVLCRDSCAAPALASCAPEQLVADLQPAQNVRSSRTFPLSMEVHGVVY